MIEIRLIKDHESYLWDEYTDGHPQSNLYHRYGWGAVINKAYGHPIYYLAAFSDNKDQNRPDKIVGALPLVHLKHILFGNWLVSIPFFDMAGLLADDEHISKRLLQKALQFAKQLHAKGVELRQCNTKLQPYFGRVPQNRKQGVFYTCRDNKVRMILKLEKSSDAQMGAFKSKLRSQIKRPLKSGLKATIGGHHLLNDFYSVFTQNMRDLGSPVHSKLLIGNVLKEFGDESKIVIVYNKSEPVACALICGYKQTLYNPWASSLRQYSKMSPNMLLYWTMLAYACDKGYNQFDFGRSTVGESTYRFKHQWGAQPFTLHWSYYTFEEQAQTISTDSGGLYNVAMEIWKRLPVQVTRWFGPTIRKHIAL